MTSKYPVVVTGGSGCLGQHLIKLLQTNADHVTEIRVLDAIPYENKLGHKEAKPVISTCGDVTDTATLRRAFRGAKSVFHLASLVSVGSFPDNQAMERINVKGTHQVIDACIKEGVDCLIYCSSVEAVLEYDAIVDGTEDNMKTPKTYYHEGYAKSKLKAESMVLQNNDCQLDTGGVLKTAALRPYVFYGELDRHYVTQLLKLVKKTAGILIQTGDGKALHQHAYVGNNAWAFICAEKAVRTNPAAAGQAYFITDDTPVDDIYSLLNPFLEEKGMRLSSVRFPFWLMFIIMYLAECLVILLSPLIKIDIGITSSVLRFANTTIKLSSVKARTLLNYMPLFSVEESLRNARAYYRDVPI
ncbi:3 beta-hydroxysteroid dehydrogenase type 7-like [Haliotis rubra]|uniref:3 beta-hydroxysteroid dehydrogenase type 7-like n=1 Tax=Haliotis rubra TaxID=36100 RepID=UPI001EE506CC|nr:3 beta-hydroxysteroid dehydrogenase type 7-like [Haliotis rubra]